MGSVVTEKVGEMEENTREGRSSSMMKDVVGCCRTVVGDNKFLFQF